MSYATEETRKGINHSLDALEMINFGLGFEAALNGLDELSDLKHNQGNTFDAETLRWAAKELRGENV